MTTTPPNPHAIARLDPQALIAKAIEAGSGIDTLERLVTLAKDIRQVSAREAWYDAMAEFQRKCPPIFKTKEARIATRTGGTYAYSYAPLDEILRTIQPVMSELGLSIAWVGSKVENNTVYSSCRISHRLGHSEESGLFAMPFQNDGRMNAAQIVGSASTYAKRYSLLAILGMAPEDDDDAQGTEPDAVRKAKDLRERTGSGVMDTAAREPIDEAQSSLPTPEEDRTYLIAEIKRLAKNIPAGDKAEAATTYGIVDSLEKTDTAALNDLLGWMRTRVKK